MVKEWFIVRDGKKHGPLTGSKIKQLAGKGKIFPTDLICKEGMKDCKPAIKVKGLFLKQSNNDPPPLPVTENSHENQSNAKEEIQHEKELGSEGKNTNLSNKLPLRYGEKEFWNIWIGVAVLTYLVGMGLSFIIGNYETLSVLGAIIGFIVFFVIHLAKPTLNEEKLAGISIIISCGLLTILTIFGPIDNDSTMDIKEASTKTELNTHKRNENKTPIAKKDPSNKKEQIVKKDPGVKKKDYEIGDPSVNFDLVDEDSIDYKHGPQGQKVSLDGSEWSSSWGYVGKDGKRYKHGDEKSIIVQSGNVVTYTKTSEWLYGRLHGIYRDSMNERNVNEKIYFKGDLRYHRSWYDKLKGILYSEEYYLDGKRHGWCTYYNILTGKVTSKVKYEHGKEVERKRAILQH